MIEGGISTTGRAVYEQGFTLIEVLMALTVFALIAGLSYSALGTAGNGFDILSEVRLTQEQSGWAARQLRSDLRYLTAAPHTAPQHANLQAGPAAPAPIRIRNDNRGDVEFDELWLLVREPGLPTISRVHYYIDEENSHLIRESRALLARDHVEPMRWDFGKVDSLSVEVWDRGGNWRQDWDFRGQALTWPKAVRVIVKTGGDSNAAGARQWWAPVLVDGEL